MGMHIGVGGRPLSIVLEGGGMAYAMGDGIFVLRQRDPTARRRKADSVVVTHRDLEALSASVLPLTGALEDGETSYMGDGILIGSQRDETLPGSPMQRVIFTTNDVARMLAAA